MKQFKKIYLLPVVIILALSSCLKKGNMNIDTSKGSKNMIEFANTGDNLAGASSTYPRFNTAFDQPSSGQAAKFNINVSYSGADVAPEDITVNLTSDTALLTTFNNQNGTSYVIPPSDVYSFPSSAIIKKGTRMAQVEASILPTSNYDYSKSYALPIKITSATTGVISSNFGQAVYSFIIKNEWHGNYQIHVSITGNNNYTGTVFDDNVSLSTISANGDSENDIADFFGGYTEYTFNSDGTISVAAYNAAGGSSYGASVLESSFDTSTHNFHVKFTILNGKYIFDLTYTRQ